MCFVCLFCTLNMILISDYLYCGSDRVIDEGRDDVLTLQQHESTSLMKMNNKNSELPEFPAFC